MSRVIIFSRTFPAYHPKKGKPTNFVEKVWASFLTEASPMFPYWMNNHECGVDIRNCYDFGPKYHTIRPGSRWKAGDKFSPRVWSDKPYRSKMIPIAPDIEIKKVWDFEIIDNEFFVNGKSFYHQHVSMWHWNIEKLSKNDGLTFGELYDWFKMPSKFKGQIICWNESVEY